MSMVKCFSLRCGEEFEANEGARDFNSMKVICPACGASNFYTEGRLRYKDRDERNLRAKEFAGEVRQQG
jgi:hypothetical protein